MNRLLSFDLKNVVSFKDVTIPIEENNGFVVIRGHNLDSNLADNPNGAGKSLLFSALPTLAYESDPLALTKRNKKDLHTVKGSCISATVLSQDKQIKLEQAGSKYKYYIDGEDQKAQKGTIARDLFSQHWTLTEDEFYSTAYIQSQRPCSFQKAKPSERLNFITDLFDLHVYDQLRAHFAKKRSAIKDKEIEFETLSIQLADIESKLGKTEWDKSSNKRLKKLKAQVETVRESMQELYDKRNSLLSSQSLFKKIADSLVVIYDLYDKIKKLGKDPAALKEKIQNQIEYQEDLAEYQEDLAKYEKRSKKYKSELDSILSAIRKLKVPDELKALVPKELNKTIDKLQSKVRDLETEADSITRDIEDAREIEEEKDELIGKVNELGYDSIAAVDTEQDWKTELHALEAIVELAQDLEGHSDCPTCLQKIDVKKMARNAKNARKRIPELKDNIEAQKHAIAFGKLSESADISKLEKRLTKVTKLLKKSKQKVSLANELRDLNLDMQDVHEDLAKLKEPAKPKGKIYWKDLDIDDLDEHLDNIEQFDKHLTRLDTQIESLPSLAKKKLLKLISKSKYKPAATFSRDSYTSVLSETDALDEEIQELQDSIQEQEKEYLQLENAKSNWSVLQDLKMEAEAKMEKSKPLIEEKKIVETLYKAYSNNNLKLQQAIKILKLIENNLNQFSHMVFPETMHFQLEAGTTGINAIVTRKNGIASDVSKLSGAETNCFRLLFAISVLPLVPASRRTNFLILDEPDSACGEAVREHLAKEFIPKLRTLVPHIFWITPKPTDIFSECEIWTVEKQNGVSTLKVDYEKA